MLEYKIYELKGRVSLKIGKVQKIWYTDLKGNIETLKKPDFPQIQE